MRRWVKAAIASAGLALGLVAVFSGTASAEPDKPDQPSEEAFRDIDPAVLERMRAQEPLAEAAERIRAVVDQGEADGFAGIGLGDGDVILWWKGSPPRAVEEVVEEERSAVRVSVTEAAHSHAELEAALAPIADDIRATPGSPYYGVATETDGSGIVVFADDSVAGAEIPERWGVPADMAVSLQIRPSFETYYSRFADIPPFWGGAAIINNDSPRNPCTAGIPVTRGGHDYMLTAGHCGRPGGGWSNGDGSRFVGVAVEENVGHDLLLVSAPVDNYLYVGGPTTTFTTRVIGWLQPFFGEYLCASGQATGTICNIMAAYGDFMGCTTDAYNNWECYDDLWLAVQVDGLSAGQGGDSGGPLFMPWRGGVTGDSFAMGTITGGWRGSPFLIFQDFQTAWWDFAVTTHP